MPEGDNLHRIEAMAGPDLVGRKLDGIWLLGLPRHDLAGRTVSSVEARGKHLLVTLEGEVVIHVHLGMNGRWRRRRAVDVERWEPARSSLLLVAGGVAHVCTNAPVAELVRGPMLAAHPVVGRLGPDLLDEEVDFAEVLRRARDPANDARDVGDLLLDQRVAAGIGNVYKSEVCYIERVHPLAPVATVDDARLEALYRTARKQLLANVGQPRRSGAPPSAGWQRTTTADRSRGELPRRGMGRVFVYNRGGRACYACGTRILSRLTGPGPRTTFWCPSCQPLPPPPATGKA